MDFIHDSLIVGKGIKYLWTRAIISKYIDYYNNERPHSAIGYETPIDFDKKLYNIKL